MILFRPDIFILLWKFRNFEENTYENHSRHHYRAGFFIGVMVNKMALSIGEQIYAALYYIMALIAFCTLSVLFDGKFTCSCNWLRRECGLPEKDLEDEDDENAAEEELTETYDGETDETEENPRRKFVKTIIITNKND